MSTTTDRIDSDAYVRILNIVGDELYAASNRYSAFNSAHEGYAVVKEELEELWEEIKANNYTNQRKEAIQLAAMALRFLIDCTNEPNQ